MMIFMNANLLPTDPLGYFQSLTSEQILDRLHAMEDEMKGLRRLLTCVYARERSAMRREERRRQLESEEAAHA
jgi:hypothetical protein